MKNEKMIESKNVLFEMVGVYIDATVTTHKEFNVHLSNKKILTETMWYAHNLSISYLRNLEINDIKDENWYKAVLESQEQDNEDFYNFVLNKFGVQDTKNIRNAFNSGYILIKKSLLNAQNKFKNVEINDSKKLEELIEFIVEDSFPIYINQRKKLK